MSSSGIEKFVERQMRNFELARSQRAGATRPATPRVFEFVAISRQKSSGGSALARGLGERLGWQVYDREILDYMARDDAVQRRIYSAADEQAVGHFESFLKGLEYKSTPSKDDYFHKLASSISAIVHSNHAIFVGRGAGHMLPPICGLRVRVVAPERIRAERHATDARCTIEEAVKRIRTIDAERDNFVRDHFKDDPKSPVLHDLVINTARLSTGAGVAVVVAALEAMMGRTLPAPG